MVEAGLEQYKEHFWQSRSGINSILAECGPSCYGHNERTNAKLSSAKTMATWLPCRKAEEWMYWPRHKRALSSLATLLAAPSVQRLLKRSISIVGGTAGNKGGRMLFSPGISREQRPCTTLYGRDRVVICAPRPVRTGKLLLSDKMKGNVRQNANRRCCCC